jgi:hypothetical protein
LEGWNGKEMTKGVDVPESSVQMEVRTLLELNGWKSHFLDVFRNVTVSYGDRGTRKFTEGTPGQADLIAVRPMDVIGMAECLYIELKRKGKKSQPHQQAWAAVVRRDGFVVLSDVTGWEDLKVKAAEVGIKIERRVK